MRLVIPAELSASLGCDAVSTPAEHGVRIMNCLPRVGCVFVLGRKWWWIVPAGSHIDVRWPPGSGYTVGTCVPGTSWTRAPGRPSSPVPRLIHRPEAGPPYTPPLPLYFLACHLAGVAPHWSPGAGRR
jgi:hypothetical protein